MKIAIKLSVVFVFLFSCNIQGRIDKPNESMNVDIVFLNKTVIIPRADSIPSVDTIYILLTNRSEFEYVFLLADSCYFIDSDPSQGIIVHFLDENNNYLKSDLVSGFTADPYFEEVKDLKFVKPNSSYLIKTPLKFPHNIKGIHMTVPDLDQAKKVRIVFDSFGFTSFFDEKLKKGLKKNQRVLGIMRDTVLPVVFRS